MLNEKKDELREISNIGLHTVITQLPTEPVNTPNLIVKRLTPRLIGGITTVLTLLSQQEVPAILCIYFLSFSKITFCSQRSLK